MTDRSAETGSLQSVAAEVRQAFEQLDLTAEEGELASLDDECARIERAIGEARNRFEELADERRGAETAAKAGADLAEALLEGRGDIDRTPRASPEQIVERQAEVREAIANLNDRLQQARRQQDVVRSAARSKVREAASPLLDLLRRDAESALASLGSTYAALSALNIACEAGHSEQSALSDILLEARASRLQLAREFEVPSSVLEAIGGLQGAEQATGRSARNRSTYGPERVRIER